MSKEERKQIYSAKGTYAGYDKNHKERESLDYYSTPSEEVTNILNILNLNFDNKIILEPCCGGGHMIKGIENYKNGQPNAIIATDIMERNCPYPHMAGPQCDFISDDYEKILAENGGEYIDYIIMNPPYKLMEPFVMKSLSIANKGVLTLARLQFLEGQSRYKNIFSHFPPSDVYIYVDRISCYKNGDINNKIASVQAYCWCYWNLTEDIIDTKVHWIRRVNT